MLHHSLVSLFIVVILLCIIYSVRCQEHGTNICSCVFCVVVVVDLDGQHTYKQT